MLFQQDALTLLPAVRRRARRVLGTALVFWPEVSGLPLDGPEIDLRPPPDPFSVFMFASGGLVGARNLGAGMPRYGNHRLGRWSTAVSGWPASRWLRGESFNFEVSVTYIGSLIWLVVMGSGVVFVMYFILIERIGAGAGGLRLGDVPAGRVGHLDLCRGLFIGRWHGAGGRAAGDHWGTRWCCGGAALPAARGRPARRGGDPSKGRSMSSSFAEGRRSGSSGDKA